jgi:UDP-GlcNAc:undecaprenyl-phosphate GlcNAc-1-phosphate transferase
MAASGLLMVGVYPIAGRVGALSQVRPDRWSNRSAVPRLAGPALLLGLLPWVPWRAGLILAAFCGVGVLDDLHRLSARDKSLLLALPTGLAAWLTGDLWTACGCFVVATAFNLLDHADGLAGTVALVSLAMAGGHLGFAGAGACAGFLLHNYPPARAYLGDGGSHLLGAAVVLAWEPQGLTPTILGSAVPLIDVGYVSLRRLIHGRAPWIGGTDHTGHELLRAGLAPRVLPPAYGAVAGLAIVLGRSLGAWRF